MAPGYRSPAPRTPVFLKPYLSTPEAPYMTSMEPGGGGKSGGRPASGRTPRHRAACWPCEAGAGQVNGGSESWG